METLDLSSVFSRMERLDPTSVAYTAKSDRLAAYTCWDGVPAEAFGKIVRLGVVLDQIIEEFQMDAIALRCWIELQELLGVSACVLLGEMNDRGVPAACEVDVGNAVMMTALHLASAGPATCLDWNNNYGDDEDKCILFHCGPVPRSLMVDDGHISDHAILANSVGPGCGYGCHIGRIAPSDFTFGSMSTDEGRLRFYLGHGTFTPDPIPPEFFGCAGVAQIANLQDVLLHVGHNGYRHHVSATRGHLAAPVREALEHYLGFEVSLPQGK
jgi:L-fucose isomerase-like protein